MVHSPGAAQRTCLFRSTSAQFVLNLTHEGLDGIFGPSRRCHDWGALDRLVLRVCISNVLLHAIHQFHAKRQEDAIGNPEQVAIGIG